MGARGEQVGCEQRDAGARTELHRLAVPPEALHPEADAAWRQLDLLPRGLVGDQKLLLDRREHVGLRAGADEQSVALV